MAISKKKLTRAIVKTATKSSTKITANSEAIRVVPLHNAKAELKLDDLLNTHEDRGFTIQPAKAAALPKLVYNGGPLILKTKVYTIFWGSTWNTNASFVTLRNNLNAFFTNILTSSLMNQMAEYSRPGKAIGHGSLSGTKVITAAAPVGSITDTKIQAALNGWIGAGTIPAWDSNTLYFIYLDKGIKVVMGGGASCTSFCGYHNAISGKKYYAVMPFPGCNGCLGGQSVTDALTGTSSHELCEAITDPVPPTGWYDNKNGEIGDICAWKFKKINGFNVQLEWSNKAGACI